MMENLDPKNLKIRFVLAFSKRFKIVSEDLNGSAVGLSVI